MQAEKKSFQTINRIPKILDLLSKNPEGLTLKSIMEGIGDSARSSIFVILQQLVNVRYLSYSESEKIYKIGPSLIKLSSVIVDKFTIQKRVRSSLEKLSRLTGENAYLGIWEQGHLIRYIDKVEGSESILLNISVGASAYLHSSAIGKLFLANINEKEQKRMLETIRLEPVTEYTITDFNQLLEELKSIKEKGYSISKEESLEGIYAIAAPIKNNYNEIIAGICVVPPKGRAIKNEDRFIHVLMEIADEINKQLNLLP